jgi:phosphatidylserine/phosphatidylglycerophosphate/cardiolipin synthase-like enzyme
VETPLDHPDIPDAHEVWRAMIEGATRSLDIAQFYISTAPGKRMEPILSAIEAAGARGVRVRVLVDQTFYAKYPGSVDQLGVRPGVVVRRFDMNALTGGVLHAKYFIVDGRDAYVGSQNFDWRSLEHIQEIGVRIRDQTLAAGLSDIFNADWEIAAGASPKEILLARKTADRRSPPVRVAPAGTPFKLTLVSSPRDLLVDRWLWDLLWLRTLIQGARRSVHVQLLGYRAEMRDGAPFPDLDDALRAAALRGVQVRLLIADWSKRPPAIRSLQRLAEVPGIEVKLVTIPRWSGGFIPFARVIHAKYMVIDGAAAWVGTSNWEGDYFTRSRNVGVIVEDSAFANRLDRIFQEGWDGPYATLVDPGATYAPPSIDRE